YMSDDRNPSFKKEELFLKVLVEGEASLYGYKDKNLIRYFYSVNNKPIKQLVFKSYRTPDKKAAKNEYYKQQINNDLKCNSISKNELVKLEYEEKRLVEIFIKYNQCKNTDFIRYKEKGKKYFFLSAKFSGNVSSLLVQKSVTVLRETEFDNKFNFSIGAEFEVVLPFYKNKWGVIVEPTYRQFKSETNAEDESLLRDGDLICTVNYKSLELPIGVRYYMFLRNKSKLFVNILAIFDFPINSTIDFIDSANGDNLTSLNVETKNNLALGFGYKYNKYSVELRMQSSREITKRYKYWRSSYNTIAFVLGYNIN
ncbi:MAG: PorT family protein, partial [Chlorobi bacterium]|nr:PorT family protein [Chlorobiota bacterium]